MRHKFLVVDHFVNDYISELNPVNISKQRSLQSLISDVFPPQIFSVWIIFEICISPNLVLQAKSLPKTMKNG